jgi:hypothetical protein
LVSQPNNNLIYLVCQEIFCFSFQITGAERERDPDYGYGMSETIHPLAGNAPQAAVREATYKLLCAEDTQAANCTFHNLFDDPLEQYALPKLNTCDPFSNGIWMPADRERHFIRLQSVVDTPSFLSGP